MEVSRIRIRCLSLAHHSNFSSRFYLVFLIGSVLFVIPTFFYFPETKGLSLEEINRLFGDDTADVDLSDNSKLVENKTGDEKVEQTQIA